MAVLKAKSVSSFEVFFWFVRRKWLEQSFDPFPISRRSYDKHTRKGRNTTRDLCPRPTFDIKGSVKDFDWRKGRAGQLWTGSRCCCKLQAEYPEPWWSRRCYATRKFIHDATDRPTDRETKRIFRSRQPRRGDDGCYEHEARGKVAAMQCIVCLRHSGYLTEQAARPGVVLAMISSLISSRTKRMIQVDSLLCFDVLCFICNSQSTQCIDGCLGSLCCKTLRVIWLQAPSFNDVLAASEVDSK